MVTRRRAGSIVVVLILVSVGIVPARVDPTMLLPASGGRDALVEMQGTAMVADDIIRLGDVARINASCPLLAQRLDGVQLTPSPRIGESSIISLGRIKTALAAEKLTVERIEFVGPHSVRVRRPARLIKAETILAGIIDDLVREAPGSRQDIWVAPRMKIEDETVPEGDLQIHYERARGRVIGDVRVTVRFEVNSVKVLLRHYSIEAGRWENVLVTTRALKKGDRLTPDCLRLERKRLREQELADIISHPAQAIGRMVATSVPAGAVVNNSLLVNRSKVAAVFQPSFWRFG